MIRVLVVDDHDLVRESVVIALDANDDIEVIGSSPDGRDAVDQAHRSLPDVIVMDLSMPIMDGVEATRRIVAQDPDARVVILTSAVGGRDVDAARLAGAVDCVFKGDRISEVVDHIRRAARPPTLGSRTPL